MSAKNFPGLFVVPLVVVGFLVLTAPLFGASSYRVLHSFNGADGANPVANLVFDAAGNLYGTTGSGGVKSQGTVFQLAPANGKWAEKVLHSFDTADGSGPLGGLIFDAAGNIYGTAEFGGTNNEGVVFELTRVGGKWTEKVLHNFTYFGGAWPMCSLVFDAAGNLYGTAGGDGRYSAGVAFELTLVNGKWKEKVLHQFKDVDGVNPEGGFIFDTAGNLYGSTFEGGPIGQGTVFELQQSGGKWTESVIYGFTQGIDGSSPRGNLISDGAGNLYGTTVSRGGHYNGNVFMLTPAQGGGWTETILYAFGDNGAYDGAHPLSSLVMDGAGNLYGTTQFGGVHNGGTVFKLSQRGGIWRETILHSFGKPTGAGPDGYAPWGSLVFDTAGNLYGTTSYGGPNDDGVVFELTP